VIITKNTPFTIDEIDSLQNEFRIYIKTVIDLENKVCSAGMNKHFEGEQILLAQGSKQSQIWGGGLNLETKEIDFNSFINIRPRDGNPKNEILDSIIRNEYEELTKFFFETIL
jgi:hypothetical protein